MTTHNGAVYLSGPIAGLTYEEARYGWRKTVADQLAPGIRALSPMRHEGHLAEVRGPLEAADQLDHFFSGSRIIVEKDRLDIERSDIVLVNLLGAMERVSLGTVAEIGMAYAMGKKVVLVIEDADEMWDGVTYVPFKNIHDHPFVTIPAALRLNNLDDAIHAINSLLSEGL
jgi:nucleoside 2-deoxyribosyltransferase